MAPSHGVRNAIILQCVYVVLTKDFCVHSGDTVRDRPIVSYLGTLELDIKDSESAMTFDLG